MTHEIELSKLAAAVSDKRKRENLGVRAAAEQVGQVSASTLSRIEKGNLPDLDTYIRLCRWLGVDPSYFTVTPGASREAQEALPDDLIVQLRADQTLSEDTRDALVTLIRAAYKAARTGDLEDEAIPDD